MAKYRGKYSKCRQCRHVRDIGMWIVWIKDSCLNKTAVKLSSGRAVDKQTCEECPHFERLWGCGTKDDQG